MPNEQSAYRLGRGMSRVWSGWARAEKWLGYWLVSIIDVSPITAKRLIWFVRVTLLVGLVYTSIWLALLIVSVGATAWTMHDSDSTNDDWPFMSESELRSSMFYDPVVHNDASHEMFEDE